MKLMFKNGRNFNVQNEKKLRVSFPQINLESKFQIEALITSELIKKLI